MITRYDCASILFYFAFVVTVGITFSRRNKNTSDYFRGGGIMPWWMAGVSAWMAGFSAWTFTGAAGKIYSQVPYVLCLYYSSILPLVVLLCFTCYGSHFYSAAALFFSRDSHGLEPRHFHGAFPEHRRSVRAGPAERGDHRP